MTFPIDAERLHRKRWAAVTLRVMARRGFSQGLVAHVTIRDPGRRGLFWTSSFGVSFRRARPADLMLVDAGGTILTGTRNLNRAALSMHIGVLIARPEALCCLHVQDLLGIGYRSIDLDLHPEVSRTTAFVAGGHSGDLYTDLLLEAQDGARLAALLRRRQALVYGHAGLLILGRTMKAAVRSFLAFDDARRTSLGTVPDRQPTAATSRPDATFMPQQRDKDAASI